MNIEQAKKYINEAISVVHELHSNSPSYNNTYHKLLTLALHELENPVVPKSNGYCSKCLWPDAQCKCPSKGYLPEAPWKSPASQRGEIVAEDMLVEVTPGPRSSGFCHNVPDRVKVTHKPTNVNYSFSTERSQHANRQKAWDKVIYELTRSGWKNHIIYS